MERISARGWRLAGAVAVVLPVLPGIAPAQTIGVQTSFTSAPWCYGGKINMIDNDEFRLSNIPANTKWLRVTLYHVDADNPHGTRTIVYGGSSMIPARSFQYVGPCPRTSGLCRWTVEALDASGAILGKGMQELRR